MGNKSRNIKECVEYDRTHTILTSAVYNKSERAEHAGRQPLLNTHIHAQYRHTHQWERAQIEQKERELQA